MDNMTRSRADNAELAPTELHARYYAQRATAGLIITEGTYVSPYVSPRTAGYVQVPGLYSAARFRTATPSLSADKGLCRECHVRVFDHPDHG